MSASPFPTNIAVSAAEFAGLATTSPILDRAGVLNGTSTSPSVTTGAATAQADELVVGVINANSLGAPRIFTAGTNGTGNNCTNTGSQTLGTLPSAQSASPIIFPVFCIVTATGLYQAAGTIDNPDSWSAVIATFRGNTAATHFAVAAPASAAPGTASSFTVTALDQFDHTATSYGGSVHFTSSDGAATLPADSTLTNGVGTFSATLRTVGNQTLTATDTVTASITGTSNVVAVSAATSFSGPSATGTGTITASFTGGGAGCTFTTARFIPLTGDPASPPAGTAPSHVVFRHGLFDFATTGCTPGSTITMTITYPSTLAPGTQYWKYGPRPGPIAAGWYVLPATVGATTITFSITDGLLGDDDLLPNGDIVDQGGPGFAAGSSVPTLSQWMLVLLSVLVLGLAMKRSGALMP